MKVKNVLKVKIYQPDAHYRVPFSYQRRFTYPIPPYSTVKGLICNLMGIRDEGDEKFVQLRDGLSMAIYGKYDNIVKEYTWFRNLSKKSHEQRFHSLKNRFIDNVPQHPGGQTPVKTDVLHNVDLLIYIHHSDDNFLKEIASFLKSPEKRTTIIHLGRAEDWLVFKEIKMIELIESNAIKIPFFTWLPSKEFVNNDFLLFSDYEDFFERINGNIFRLPMYYIIIKYNQRIFNKYITVKLFEGGSFRRQKFYCDSEEANLPIIFTDLRGNANE